jgi:hypothetical protein
VGGVFDPCYGSVRKVLLVEWEEVEPGGCVPDLLRRNIFLSFSMKSIFHPTNGTSVNSSVHEDFEYM